MPSAAEAGFGQLDYAGTLVIVGTGFEPPRINQNRMIIFELEIIGAYNYNDEGFQPAVDLLDSGTLPLDALIEPDERSAQRRHGLHGAPRPGRDPEQGDGPTGPVRHEPDAVRPADQPRGDQRRRRGHGRGGSGRAAGLLLRGLRVDRGGQQHGEGKSPHPLHRVVGPVPLPAAGEGRIHGHAEHGPLRDGGVLQGGDGARSSSGSRRTRARTTASGSPRSAPW